MNSEDSIIQILKNALSNDKNIINSAITILEKMALENFSLFLAKLGAVLATERNDSNIRQMAAIMMKNSLIHVDSLRDIWSEKLKAEEKTPIKLLVLSTLASSKKEIRKSASLVIASICKIDQPVPKYWEDLIPSLTNNCFNSDINLRLAAIETLGYVCEEVSLKGIDSSNVDTILNALIQNLVAKENQQLIVETTLKALYHVIKFAEKNFSNENERKIIMSSIFGIVQQYQNQDEILMRVAMLLIEMLSISSYYEYMSTFFTELCDFSFYIINEKAKTNETLSMLGLEIWCSLGDEELKRVESGKIVIKTGVAGLVVDEQSKPRLNYVSKVSKKLEELIIQHVVIPSEDEDDSEWTISKACLYILGILVQVIDKTDIQNFFIMLNNQINYKNNDVSVKCKCWLLLAGSLPTIYKSDIAELLTKNFSKIIEDLNNKTDKRMAKTASFLLVKITKHLPKLFDIQKLHHVLPIFISCLNEDNSIALNICQVLQNLIKANGDINTKKNSNHLSQEFDCILSELFKKGVNENTIIHQNKLALNCLVTIGLLIEYSSHDKQDTIYQALVAFLTQIEKTMTEFQQYLSQGSKPEHLFQIQDYLYAILRIVFIKYKMPIDLNLGLKIWLLTDQLFKLRKIVFEEANLALGALALNMKESFGQIFTFYWPFLEFSIKSYTDSSLSKSGLSSLLSSIRSIGKELNALSTNVIKSLIEFCTSNDVSRSNKTIAITCLGEIAMKMGLDFSQYLSTVMGLLFSACQMANQIDDPEDEETVEFIKDLQYELIQTFTCITFSLEEKPDQLIPYVPNIIGFFKAVTAIDFAQRPTILKSILLFITDMVYLYGKELKAICDEKYVTDLIKKLRAFHLVNIEEEICQQEEVLKCLFR